MRQSSRLAWRMMVGLLAMALIAGACGSDDDGAQSEPTGSTASTTSTTAGDGEPEPEGLVIDGELVADQELLDAARAEGTLTVYSMLAQDMLETLAAEFEADTGVKMVPFRAPSAELTQRVETETSAGVHAFDILHQSGPGDMARFLEQGILTPYEVTLDDPPWLNPEEIQEDFGWYPFGAYVYLPAYNSAVLPDGLTIETWDDIFDPAVKGRVGITPAGVGGTGIGMAAFQREVLGEEHWDLMAAADPVIFSSTVTVADGLGRGELMTAISGESVLLAQIEAGAPVVTVYPEVGLIGGVNYMGVAAEAPNPNAARLYMNWTLSKRTQALMEECCFVRTIRQDTPPIQHEHFPATSDLNIWWPNLSTRGDTTELVNAWNQALGYTG